IWASRARVRFRSWPGSVTGPGTPLLSRKCRRKATSWYSLNCRRCSAVMAFWIAATGSASGPAAGGGCSAPFVSPPPKKVVVPTRNKIRLEKVAMRVSPRFLSSFGRVRLQVGEQIRDLLLRQQIEQLLGHDRDQ